MTLDTLIETGKILSYSEGESYMPIVNHKHFSTESANLGTIYDTNVIFMVQGIRFSQTFHGTTRKDVTQQVIKYFS